MNSAMKADAPIPTPIAPEAATFPNNQTEEEQQRIISLVQQCQRHATEAAVPSPSSCSSTTASATDTGSLTTLRYASQILLIKNLKSLHHELISIRREKVKTVITSSAVASNEEDVLNNKTTTARKQEQMQHFLRKISQELMCLNRVILSIDEEINGTLDEEIAHLNLRGDTERWIDKCLDQCGFGISLEAAVDCLRQVLNNKNSPNSNEKSAEKNITEIPGLAAVITSLRTIRRRLILVPFPSVFHGSPEKKACFPIALSNIGNNNLTCIQKMHQLWEYVTLPLEYYKNIQDQQQLKQYRERIVPTEGEGIVERTESILSESLVNLATSVLPTLVASACHSMDLPLPMWATPRKALGLLLHCSWRTTLAGEVLGEMLLREKEGGNFGNYSASSPTSTMIRMATSEYFQSLLRRLIISGHSELVVNQIYQIWKSCTSDDDSIDNNGNGDNQINGSDSVVRQNKSHDFNALPSHDFKTLRSILCIQLQKTLVTISSKREVAKFIRKVAHHVAKQQLASHDELGRQDSFEKFEKVCKSEVLPFLKDALLQTLSHDRELREAVVQFVILSPPTSFHQHHKSSSATVASSAAGEMSFPILHAVDKAVLLCITQLLASACANGNRCIVPGRRADVDSESESDDDAFVTDLDSGSEIVGHFLSCALSVGSVWSEDTFVTRTDTLQQQYVTEFLLYSLKGNFLSQNDVNLQHPSGSLASMLVQGITFRLEVSRAASVRIDGMLIAEAMAKLLGQNLRFEELHSICENASDVIKGEHKILEKKGRNKDRKRNKQRRTIKAPRAHVVIDPDAEYVSDDNGSTSSDDSQLDDFTNSDESNDSSDQSTWGEDSIQPYPMEDDEDDLRRVPRPHTLRDCIAYLVENENDTLAYDKHESALLELPNIISAQPLDLLDVTSTLVRVLLHMEDKFNMDQFTERRLDSLMALGVQSPLDTTLCLVEEMRGNVSLGTRLEALSIIGGVAQELSGLKELNNQRLKFEQQQK